MNKKKLLERIYKQVSPEDYIFIEELLTTQVNAQVEEAINNLEGLYNKLFELDENESYKHFDSIGESYQYHNKYVSIKSALGGSNE